MALSPKERKLLGGKPPAKGDKSPPDELRTKLSAQATKLKAWIDDSEKDGHLQSDQAIMARLHLDEFKGASKATDRARALKAIGDILGTYKAREQQERPPVQDMTVLEMLEELGELLSIPALQAVTPDMLPTTPDGELAHFDARAAAQAKEGHDVLDFGL